MEHPHTGHWYRALLDLPEVVDVHRYQFGPITVLIQLVRVEVGLPEPHYRPRISVLVPMYVLNMWNLAQQGPPPPPYLSDSLPSTPPANQRRPMNPVPPSPPAPPMEEE